MSTEDAGSAGSGRRAPDATTAPAGDHANAGEEVRPRGRRFSGRRPASGAGGQPRSRSAPDRRSYGGGIPADDPTAPTAPTAADLDAISLAGDERRATAQQTAEAVVGSAGAEVAAEPDPRNPGTAPPLGITEPRPAGPPDQASVPAEMPGDPGPAWPVSWHRGRGAAADDGLPTSVISGSILPGARGVAVAGPGPGSVAAPAAGRVGRPVTVSRAAADEAVSPPLFLLDASRAVLAWAGRRHLGLSAATGISVALASCAAAWFSAGTTADTVRGVAVLWFGYLVLVAGRSVARQAAGADANLRVTGPVRWLAALGGSVAEAAVYAGLAVGAAAQRYPGTWVLGVGVVGLVAARNVMTACSTPYGLSHPPQSLPGRVCADLVTMAQGGRILVIGLVAPFWGPRAALLVLVAWAISSIGYGLAGRAVPDVAAEPRGQDDAPPTSATVLRLRDDGMLARYLGGLVRGILLPLPPALLGLAAVTAFAVLGLHDLRGPLLIAPAFVMMLAAPGSANPHLGRLDWLVPVLLLSAQVLYIGVVGAAGRVPGPIVFALAAALLARYTDLACAQRPVLLVKSHRRASAPREYGSELGWEGRLLFVGVTAAIGLATAGYVALTAYLVLLIGAKAARSFIVPPDDDTA